jgi:hypothetical protein
MCLVAGSGFIKNAPVTASFGILQGTIDIIQGTIDTSAVTMCLVAGSVFIKNAPVTIIWHPSGNH